MSLKVISNLLHKTGFSGLSVTIQVHKEMVCRSRPNESTRRRNRSAPRTPCAGQASVGKGAIPTGSALCGRFRLSLRSQTAAPLSWAPEGAARAVAYGLKRAGASVTISNRCIERGSTLAKELKSEFIPLNILGETAVNFDIVVQCTSVGLKDAEASPIAFDTFFRPEMTVMDIIYSPPWTAFLKAAGNAGCTIVPGLEMLLYQGAAQLEWWLERPIFQTPAIAAMRRALLAAAEGSGEPGWRSHRLEEAAK